MTAKDELIGRIMRGEERLAHLFAFDRSDPLMAANLTMPQLKVLFLLSLHGGATSQDLTAAMGITAATMTGIVDRLAAQELVTRREDPRDRRVRRVEPTPAGKELIDSIMVAGAEHQRRLLLRLTVAQLHTVETAVGLMLAAAEAEAASAPHPAATVCDITPGATGA